MSVRDAIIEIDPDDSPPLEVNPVGKTKAEVEVTASDSTAGKDGGDSDGNEDEEEKHDTSNIFKITEVGEDSDGVWQYKENDLPEDKVVSSIKEALEQLENNTTPKSRTLCIVSFNPYRKDRNDELATEIGTAFGCTWSDTSNRLTLFHHLPPRLQHTDDSLKISPIHVYRSSSLAADVLLACSDDSMATVAFIWSCYEADRWIYETAPDLLKAIKMHYSLAAHPMLLLVLACREMIEEALAILRVAFAEVDEAALMTQFSHRRHDTADRTMDEIDLSQFSAEVSGMAMNIAQFGNSLDELLEVANCILAECDLLEARVKSSGETHPAKGQLSWTQANNFMRQNATGLVRKAKSARIESNAWQHTASIMVQGLFNLIAQRDQNQNIRIANDTQILARESKRDSTAMKAIAFVTMIFLPGTFLSSVFSMDLFTWNAPHDSDVVNGRIWIYWATVIPLTIVVVAFFLLWERYMMRLYQKSLKPPPEGVEPETKDKTDDEKASVKTGQTQQEKIQVQDQGLTSSSTTNLRDNDNDSSSFKASTVTRRRTDMSRRSEYSWMAQTRFDEKK